MKKVLILHGRWWDWNENWFPWLKKLWNNYTIFLSDNDPYIIMESAKQCYLNLENVKFIEFHNIGHFNEWAWIYELPEIMDYISI